MVSTGLLLRPLRQACGRLRTCQASGPALLKRNMSIERDIADKERADENRYIREQERGALERMMRKVGRHGGSNSRTLAPACYDLVKAPVQI